MVELTFFALWIPMSFYLLKRWLPVAAARFEPTRVPIDGVLVLAAYWLCAWIAWYANV